MKKKITFTALKMDTKEHLCASGDFNLDLVFRVTDEDKQEEVQKFLAHQREVMITVEIE